MKRYLFISNICLVLFIVFSLQATDLKHTYRIFSVHDGENYSLGVAVGGLAEDLQKETGLKGGARIVEVLPRSEAERIGLQEDDIIVKFDGQKISSPRKLYEIFSAIKEKKTAEITVYRDGKEKKFQTELEPRKPKEIKVHFRGDDLDLNLTDLDSMPHNVQKAFEAFHPFNEKGGFLGVLTENLTDQLRKFFDVEYGVLVEEVVKDSPAEKTGLQAGDVIVQIDDRKIEDTQDLRRILDYHNSGDQITLVFNCRGKRNEVKITLANKKGLAFLPDGMDEERIIRIPEIKIEEEKIRDLEKVMNDFTIDIELYVI